MYKVGDYVYFEISSSLPYQIRRIEELIKTPNGNVEAKVMCFFRRRDLSSSLIQLADKHHSALEEEQEKDVEQLTEKQKHQLKHRELFLSRQIETLPATHIRGKCTVTLLNETESLSSYLNKDDTFFYALVYDPQQKTLLADKGEIRVGSRYQAEVPPAPIYNINNISETNVKSPLDNTSKINNDNCSETEVNDEKIVENQAQENAEKVAEENKVIKDDRDLSKLETLVYKEDNGLNDKELDKYLIIAKSVGTFARALDHTNSIKQPSLHMSAAAASRDITIQYAMDLLHQSDYNLSKAILSLVPSNGPILCRDEMEEWSSSEAYLFEEGMEKYGKDFNDIRQDFLPWKSLQNIVEYYYMWKTTDRYMQQKRIKAAEADSKPKQVYVPNYNKQMQMNGGNGINDNAAVTSTKPCESCGKTNSSQWYPWGPAHVQCRLCHSCWMYWKKFSGLKYQSKIDVEKINQAPRTNDHQNAQYPCRECNKVFNRQERLIAHLATHRPHRCTLPGCGKEFKFKAHLIRHCAQIHGVAIRAGSPRPIVKTRAAFYLHTSQATKSIRRLFISIIRPRKLARAPFVPVNSFIIKQECALKFPDNNYPTLSKLKTISRGKVNDVSHRLGTPQMPCPEWLIATPKDQLPKPEREMFPPPEKGKDGQFIIPRLKEDLTPKDNDDSNNSPKVANWGINNLSPSLLRKRTYEQQNGGNGTVGHNNNTCPVPLKRRSYAQPSIMPRSSHGHDMYRNVGLPRDSLMAPLNGRAKITTITRVGGRKQMISWVDAPDDVYFVATDSTRRLRKHLTPSELKRSARRPWRRIPLKNSLLNSLSSLNHPSINNSSHSGPNPVLNASSIGQVNVPMISEPISMTMME